MNTLDLQILRAKREFSWLMCVYIFGWLTTTVCTHDWKSEKWHIRSLKLLSEGVTAGVLQVRACVVHGGETEQKAGNSISALLRAPRAACCVLLNSISLYWRTNWKSVTLFKRSLGWYNQRRQLLFGIKFKAPKYFFFPSLSQHKWSLVPSIPATPLFCLFQGLEVQQSQRQWFFGDVCCSRHQSEAEHSTILAEELGINISFLL